MKNGAEPGLFGCISARACSEIRLLSVLLKCSLGCLILRARRLEGFLGFVGLCLGSVYLSLFLVPQVPVQLVFKAVYVEVEFLMLADLVV
jgi:hypothetical protein